MGLDWSTIIVAGLALVGTLAGSYFANNKSTALISYRLQQLEDKVNKHNNVVERMAVIERDVKTVFNRVDDLRKDLHDIK